MTGPGGVGKTRVALQAAQLAAAAFPDGVWFVDLAPIRDPTLVPTTVARALGLWDASPASAADRLIAVLHNQRVLLVLDNFEQLLAAAPYVSALLAACPQAAVLATSRSRLRVTGEHEYPLPPRSNADASGSPLCRSGAGGPA